jgi:hypothetical protein
VNEQADHNVADYIHTMDFERTEVTKLKWLNKENGFISLLQLQVKRKKFDFCTLRRTLVISLIVGILRHSRNKAAFSLPS